MDATASKMIRGLEEKVAALAADVAALKAHLLGEKAVDLPDESDAERLFRTKIGPFLNAIDVARGAVAARQFRELGRRFGYDPRGLGGFTAGANPSIRSQGDLRALTPRGKALAAQWRANIEAIQARLATRFAEGGARYAALPPDSPERAEFRREIRGLAERWRDYVYSAADEPKGEPVGATAAAGLLGVDQAGLAALTGWGLLTHCPVPTGPGESGQLVLRREIEALQRDRTWWRGLADLVP